jgi:molybdopterin-guanine dinucleotide biosynthesis protein B
MNTMRIIGLAGWSGSGKTTLITKVIPCLLARGLKVSTLKHAHHGFDLDQPGKDSFFHRAAGATEVIVSSAKRFAILHELRGEPEWDLGSLVGKMSPVDLVLVEGYKRDAFPKLEIHRAANGKPLIYPEDPHIIAIASDVVLPAATVPVVDLNDIEAIADLLFKHAVPIDAADATARS